jgi:hypothetical protein
MMQPPQKTLTPAQRAAAARAAERAQAEAKALRENLAKRKVQARETRDPSAFLKRTDDAGHA